MYQGMTSNTCAVFAGLLLTRAWLLHALLFRILCWSNACAFSAGSAGLPHRRNIAPSPKGDEGEGADVVESLTGTANNERQSATAWPSLYEEAEEMIAASYCAYPITILRREASDGNLKDNERVLALLGYGTSSRCIGRSLAVTELVQIVSENFDYLKGKYCTGSDEFTSIDAFKKIADRANAAGDPRTITLEEYDNRNEERRLVYGIAIDRIRKRITVIFRGTFPDGTDDWKRNFQFDMLSVKTPPSICGYNNDGIFVPDELRVHRGFYEYMFQNSERDPRYPKERYDEILDFIVPLLKEFPDFKLYITGHSLGGALGTLTAFRMAASLNPDIPKPVTCVSIGAPLVGDKDFRAAFQVLERKGLVRHLRVTNHDDIIPFGWPFSFDGKLYRHVGLHLELYNSDSGFQLGYHKVTPAGNVDRAVYFPRLSRDYNKAHSVSEYMIRVMRAHDALETEQLSLNGLYRSAELVGDLKSSLKDVCP